MNCGIIAVVLIGIILSLIGKIFEHSSSIIIELTDYSIWSILIGYNMEIQFTFARQTLMYYEYIQFLINTGPCIHRWMAPCNMLTMYYYSDNKLMQPIALEYSIIKL